MNFLYIEDDEIDVMGLKRMLTDLPDVRLSICTSFSELQTLDIASFDRILCDSNLPDANIKELRKFLKHPHVQFLSGTETQDFNVWVKPVNPVMLKAFLSNEPVVDFDYIKNLADGDSVYEQDMVETAIRILPERFAELKEASSSLQSLKKAAHKMKSSYRVCGIENSLLNELENINPGNFDNRSFIINLIESIRIQIDTAIAELQSLLR